ncbi:hypothetical protein MUK70_05960 [Dyadobacter chenwenxiniae]|uniref:C1q domain-containing protein n=1 Tax=Dyadobacter chenwenxiniae TaxID=2906456 RepID=A0A9X1PQJ2_9BACT|nr:hypothetical protein [Dyadobacter chenwenxiniae]MCF0065198.1 hypothetical protein [Dyadobacter chenwenxiniae]UON84532.1 hypothetical protein MUK70_05960 [Dyadobacter chenwenxiniae]
MKKVVLLILSLCWHHILWAQTFGNVGINTFHPDPSAALEVRATNKGVLFPKVYLQSATDNATIPLPAKGLMLFNTNSAFGKAGLYYNNGTPILPYWTNVEAKLKLPYSDKVAHANTLFAVNNLATTASVRAVQGSSDLGIGIMGRTMTGTGVAGHNSGTGTGVLAVNNSGQGLAMEVNGKIHLGINTKAPAAGDVLTSDALGYASWQPPIEKSSGVAFSAVGILGNGNENMSQNSYVKLAFANEVYDVGSDYNDATQSPHSSFIAPKSGIYHFKVAVLWKDQTQDANLYGPTIRLQQTRNNATTILAENRAWVYNWGGGYRSCIEMDCQLQQGDVINTVARAYGSQIVLLRKQAFFPDNIQSSFSGNLVLEL